MIKASLSSLKETAVNEYTSCCTTSCCAHSNTYYMNWRQWNQPEAGPIVRPKLVTAYTHTYIHTYEFGADSCWEHINVHYGYAVRKFHG